MKAKVFWNVGIRYSLQYYLKIAFTSVPILLAYQSESLFETVYSGTAVCILMALPVVYGVILYR